jgi:hypothetical protein
MEKVCEKDDLEVDVNMGERVVFDERVGRRVPVTVLFELCEMKGDTDVEMVLITLGVKLVEEEAELIDVLVRVGRGDWVKLKEGETEEVWEVVGVGDNNVVKVLLFDGGGSVMVVETEDETETDFEKSTV